MKINKTIKNNKIMIKAVLIHFPLYFWLTSFVFMTLSGFIESEKGLNLTNFLSF
jgi:hypothetical protein